jgi:hypothetical protein
MVRLWQWLKTRGRANDKPVAEDDTAGAATPVRTPAPHSKAAAVEQAADNWTKDGDRADQDYYHVPGAGNPDLKDPPALKGKPLPKPRKQPRARSDPA